MARQYVMAADRTNARVAKLAGSFQPAVLRMIHQTVQAERDALERQFIEGALACCDQPVAQRAVYSAHCFTQQR